MSWLDQYKDAILQAVWDSGVMSVGTDEESASGRDEWPVLRVGIVEVSEKDIEVLRFKESLKNRTGEDQPFSVVGMSPRDVAGMSVILYRGGAWRHGV